jgi:hypothetical protein
MTKSCGHRRSSGAMLGAHRHPVSTILQKRHYERKSQILQTRIPQSHRLSRSLIRITCHESGMRFRHPHPSRGLLVKELPVRRSCGDNIRHCDVRALQVILIRPPPKFPKNRTSGNHHQCADVHSILHGRGENPLARAVFSMVLVSEI